ncbi:MAG: hypothetical protein ACTSW4_06395 [Candidatus Ranarchaeia archaeon]
MTIAVDLKSIKPILRLISISDLTWDGFVAEVARFMAEDFFINAVFRGIVPIEKPILHEEETCINCPPMPSKSLKSLVGYLKKKIKPYLKLDIENNRLFDNVFTTLFYVNDWPNPTIEEKEPSAHLIDNQRLLVILNKNHLDFDPELPFMPSAPIPSFRVSIILTVLLSEYFGWSDYRPQYIQPERVQQILDAYESGVTIHASKIGNGLSNRAFDVNSHTLFVNPITRSKTTEKNDKKKHLHQSKRNLPL